MNPIDFEYSTKNIPTLNNNNEYMKTIINKAEKFIRNLRWRAFFFLNPSAKTREKNTYGFNSTKAPPVIAEMKEFEDGMLKLIQSIEFKKTTSKFQKRLDDDIRKIKNSNDIYVKADKTTNFYKVEYKKYEEMIQQNLQKDYHKVPITTMGKQTRGDKQIAERLEISDRIDTMAKKEAFITLKDHKENFRNRPQCRLINPSKTEIGKISKKILEKINNKIRQETRANQWRNTDDVIDWFEKIPEKRNCNAITFDICEFYPSISEEILDRAIEFAEQYCKITKEEKHIIKHTKGSTVFHNGETWKKNGADFDVPMGSFDSAETCELVGLFMLSKLQNIDENIGLYRDDGLAIIRKSKKETENMKKEICKIFNENNLRITIQANKQIVDFLDTTFDLKNESYQPYMKTNNKPLYVHKESNHPPSVIKNIPEGINKRLASISSNEEIFKRALPPYEKALEESGYQQNMTFKKEYKIRNEKKSKKKRKRKITWFNPPYSKNVKTNIGQKFLKLIDECFPTEHRLHSVANRNNIKISYSCLPNFGQIINTHNKRIMNNNKGANNEKEKECNCRKKDECPMNNKCLTKAIVYQARITHPGQAKKEQTYIGSTENTFKTRYNEHKNSFTNVKKRNATTLSEYIWKCREEDAPFEINWKIITKANPYGPQQKRCNLCTTEKTIIITQPHNATLNRNNLVTTCRHRQKHTLSLSK